MSAHRFLLCLKIPWATHTLVPNTLSVFHQPSSFSVIRDRCGNLPWESGFCVATQVETSVISLSKLFILTGCQAEDHHNLVVWDLTVQTGDLPGSHRMFLSPWIWVLFPQEEEGVRWEGKRVIHTQARKPACTPRLTAAGTADTGQGNVLQIISCFVFHQQPVLAQDFTHNMWPTCWRLLL